MTVSLSDAARDSYPVDRATRYFCSALRRAGFRGPDILEELTAECLAHAMDSAAKRPDIAPRSTWDNVIRRVLSGRFQCTSMRSVDRPFPRDNMGRDSSLTLAEYACRSGDPAEIACARLDYLVLHERLSPQRAAIADLVIEGEDTATIAEMLHISQQTVCGHIKKIRAKVRQYRENGSVTTERARLCVERDCDICGKTYAAKLWKLARGEGRTCSRDCSYVLRGRTISAQRRAK